MTAFLEMIAQSPYLVYSVILVVSVLSASLGIGGFILIPLAALYFGAKESLGIVTIYFLFQNISKLVFFQGHINFKIAKKVIIWSIPGVIAGALLVSYIPESLFEKLLGFAIILFLINDAHDFIRKKKKSEKAIPVFGFFYGFSSGLLGSGNLVKGPLFVSLGLRKEAYIATYALTSLFMNLPKIGIYSWSGIITVNTLIQSVPFLFISILGTWFGKKVLKHISNRFFYLIMIGFYLVTAAWLIVK